MILKSINVIMAYLIACFFTAICVVLTFYLPQMPDASGEINNQLIVRVIFAFGLGLMFFSSPLTLIAGLFAYFKKIISPAYYVVCGLFSIMITLGFTEIFQGIEGYEGEFVPLVAFVASGAAGYIFWYLAIRRPKAKTQQA